VKIEEIQSKTDDELAYELGKMKKELFELRFKSRTAGVPSPARLSLLRRTIARVHTVRHERARQSGAQARTKESRAVRAAKSKGRAGK
jgi:large subunit ribosomal protein L29